MCRHCTHWRRRGPNRRTRAAQQQALRRFVARPSPQKIPRGPLVLLADGLWFEFDGIPWVLYLTSLKPCRGNQATFLDPILLPGREGASRWQQALVAIPPTARRRIQAMVVDNLPGMRKLAHQHRWVLQLCHFHLLLKLLARRGRVRYTLRIQTTVREFLVNLQFYRSYLMHPTRLAAHYQRRRVHAPSPSRDASQQSSWLQSGLPAALGDSAHSLATDPQLQRAFPQQKILTHPQIATTHRPRVG